MATKKKTPASSSAANQPSPPGPLAEFWAFVGDFNSVYANIAKFAIAAPLLDLIVNIGPPWPSRLGVSFAIVALQVLVLMCSFSLWRQGAGKVYHIKIWLLASSVCFAICFLFGYLPLFTRLIENNPDAWNRVIVGDDLHVPLKEFVEAEARNGRTWPPKKLLEYFYAKGEDETAIWTSESVARARSLILGVWLALCILYAIAVSAFVSIQYRRIQ